MTDLVYTNSMISARAAVYMLNHARIQSLVRARNQQAAAKVLQDMDYKNINGTTDAIIETERKRTFETFVAHCPDRAVNECVTAMYKFITTKVPQNKTLAQAEQELNEKLGAAIPKVKSAKLRAYFQTILDAWAHGRKVFYGALWEAADEMKTDLGSVGPLFYWYVQKQFEFVVVRIILTGRLLGFDRDRIIEDLEGLYERFK